MTDSPNQTTKADSPVCVVDGYGLSIRVERRHLIIDDGAGRHRRTRRYAKVNHGLQRLVVIGHTGAITLDALNWLHDTRIAFVHLAPNNTLRTFTAARGLDDPRLRRAQALAPHTPEVAQHIATDILTTKVNGQATVADTHLHNAELAEQLRTLAGDMLHATEISELVELEADAARRYFNHWHQRLNITWAKHDLPRIPQHWNGFNGRRSANNPTAAIRATDPTNALLNYLYALAEAECVLACHTLGLDPGLGIIHKDTKNRDSLALDLIETIRPVVDAYLIDLIDGHTFRADDFHEHSDGHTRITAPLTHQLAQTLTTWRAAVAAHAEHVAHALADASPRPITKHTPLTSSLRRSKARQTSQDRRKGRVLLPAAERARGAPSPPRACPDCGASLGTRRTAYCGDCWASRRLANGRQGSRRAAEQAATAAGRRARSKAISTGKASAIETAAGEAGITTRQWHRTIQPKVSRLTLRQIMQATGLSQSYSSKIKRGIHTPHPKHWQPLQEATRSSADDR